MTEPSMMKALFHVHFFVPNMTQGVREMERFYQENLSYKVVARYGYIDDAHQRFSPDVRWEELEAQKFRLRLVELERGAVNQVLMPSQFSSAVMEHFGILLEESDYEHAFSIAKSKQLRFKRDAMRSFIYTPFGFAVELQLVPQDRYTYTEADFNKLQVESLALGAKEPEKAAEMLAELLNLNISHNQKYFELKDDRCNLHIQASERRLVQMNLACSPQAAQSLKIWPDPTSKRFASFQDPFGVSITIQLIERLA